MQFPTIVLNRSLHFEYLIFINYILIKLKPKHLAKQIKLVLHTKTRSYMNIFFTIIFRNIYIFTFF